MDYFGSKEKLNNWIFEKITQNINPEDTIFLDACTGSGAVSRYAATLGFKKIISNDILEFPLHIVRGSISLPNSKLELAKYHIEKMNNAQPTKGFFFDNYSQQAGRLYFTNENAKKIDACRDYIDHNCDGEPYLKSYLLYCLIEALSSVSNTAGQHAAFLKHIKERATKKIVVNAEETLSKFQLVKTYNMDILTLLKSKEYRITDGYIEDVLYVDPPYNERQYGSNYHLYETLVKYDNPAIYGKTGLRDWQNESKSQFCSKKYCLDFLQEIIDNTTAKKIFVSYNSDGLMEINEINKQFKNAKIYSKEYRRFKSDSSNKRKYNDTELKEYLIEITK